MNHKMHPSKRGERHLFVGTNKSTVNLNQFERILSGLAGVLLVKQNLGRFSLNGFAKLFTGGALLRRAITGHCNIYEAMSISSAHTEPAHYHRNGATTSAFAIKNDVESEAVEA